MRFSINHLDHAGGDSLGLEIVERKGLGHPDTICDEIAEQLSLTLSHRYISECGQILHHNVDKVLLVGGSAHPAFGGGKVVQPMDLFLAGRATTSFERKELHLDDIVRQVALDWLSKNIPTVDTEHHVRVHNMVRQGSTDLGSLFSRRVGGARLANDTSCGVGYAPLSRLETIVYFVEQELGAAAECGRRREIGRDIKVMGVRYGEHIHLTIACALVGRFIENLAHYTAIKSAIVVMAYQTAKRHGADTVTVDVNTADDPSSGSVYLTVTGTSAEAGDDGEAGRGNRINGLISPFRPMTLESVAGKNPVTHVGKVYNITANLIAQRLIDEMEELDEAQCFIASQIGCPLQQPQAIQIFLHGSSRRSGIDREISAIVESELSRLGSYADELASGTLAVGRWPLKQLGGAPSR